MPLLSPVLPARILEQSSSSMFPTDWHIQANYIWGIQIWILFLQCIYLRRWLPSQWASSRALSAEVSSRLLDEQPRFLITCEKRWLPPWTVWQFWFMLLTHSIFYLVELDTTSMHSKYTVMAIHHWLALLTFLAYAANANCFSVLSLTPFVLHNLFWSLGGNNLDLLGWYNVFIVFCGFVGIVQILAIEKYCQGRETSGIKSFEFVGYAPPISLALPYLSIAIGANNYYCYCQFYDGYWCTKVDNRPLEDKILTLVCSTVIWVIFVATGMWWGTVIGQHASFVATMKDSALAASFTETRHIDNNNKLQRSSGGRISAWEGISTVILSEKQKETLNNISTRFQTLFSILRNDKESRKQLINS